jgi:hypothetical protein
MSDLREQLASYFKAVHHRHEHGIGGPCDACAGLVPADQSANDMVWFVMADETIRQMQFARRCVGISGPTTYETTELRFGEIVPVTKTVKAAEPYLPPLMLAPDDWQAEVPEGSAP